MTRFRIPDPTWDSTDVVIHLNQRSIRQQDVLPHADTLTASPPPLKRCNTGTSGVLASMDSIATLGGMGSVGSLGGTARDTPFTSFDDSFTSSTTSTIPMLKRFRNTYCKPIKLRSHSISTYHACFYSSSPREYVPFLLDTQIRRHFVAGQIPIIVIMVKSFCIETMYVCI